MLIAPEDPGADTLRVPVLKVFDGDGFLTRIDFPRHRTSAEVTIRFGFIDAPEMEQPGGPDARDFLSSLIDGKLVDVAILTKMDTGGIIDRHGRIVAVPYLRADQFTARASPWGSSPVLARNIELEMVINGWAWVLDRYGPDRRYFDALDDARRHRRGIWAFRSNVHPWHFKKQRYRDKTAVRSSRIQPDLFSISAEGKDCPNGCGGRLVQRTGRYGSFFGCSNFPSCRYCHSI